MLLSTDVWVAALIRRAEQGGAFAAVARKGDARAGAVIVKAYNTHTREARIYTEAFRGDGERVWMQPYESPVESEVDAYIAKSRRIDPDLWVIEIEDAEGRHFIVEPVEKR